MIQAQLNNKLEVPNKDIKMTDNKLAVQRPNDEDDLRSVTKSEVLKDGSSDSETSLISDRSLEQSNSINETDLNSSNEKQIDQSNSSTLVLGNQIKSGQLFGPFTDPIQWLAIRHSTTKHSLPKEFCSLEPDLLALFRNIQMANSSEKQNMEIIVRGNKFYFRAMQSIDLENSSDCSELLKEELKRDTNIQDESTEPSNERPLFAWFSSELSSRLPTPAMSVINGNKRYFCTKCNQVFIYPNPAVLHILFACTASNPSSLSNGTERLASPCGRSDNNNSSLSIGSNSSYLDNQATKMNRSNDSGYTVDTSYTPLNGSVSLANSKILKNLEAKLCKQFSSTQAQNNISGDNVSIAITNSNNNSSNNNNSSGNNSGNNNNSNNNSNSYKLTQTKSTKQLKKRAFDIESLVNTEQTSTSIHKKHKSTDKERMTKKNDNSSKIFKTPLSTVSSSSNHKATDSLANFNLINSLNSPLSPLMNSSFLNPFSLLDPLTSNLSTGDLTNSSAFHKVDNSLQSKLLLNNSSSGMTGADHTAGLLNAAAMFSHANPNFPNPFDLAALYAQHQRNLLQSMFQQSQASNQLHSNASSSAGSLNYLQSQLTNPLFASQNLANLSNLNTLNSLNNFNNGLNNLLVNQSSNGPSSTLNSSNLTSNLASNLPSTLANSLFGLTGQLPSQTTGSQSNSQFNSIDPFLVPQSTDKVQTVKKKKAKEKDLNNNSNASKSSSSSSQTNSSQLNQTDPKLNSLIPPSYLQFLPPSLAALSHPQSNWCAKCNISFRMTSDLVYHMRSAHKDSPNLGGLGERQSSSSPKRKKDENKLYCHICSESFKERHHLSRHLSSH